MIIYFILFFTAFLLTIILIPIIKRISFKYNLFDNPFNDYLKIHKMATPFLGGGAMLASFLAVLFIAWLFGKYSFLIFNPHQLVAIFIGSIVAWFYGFWDDFKWQVRFQMSQATKLFFQIPIVLVLVLLLYLEGVYWQFIPNPFFGVIIGSIYFIVILNAVNVQDGLDGLAGGVIAMSTFGFLLLSFWTGNTLGVILSLATIGGILGFLIYNWHPASIFMGNNGSYFLGFLMTYFVISNTRPWSFSWLVIPLFILGMPIFNIAFVVLRRLIKKQPILTADRHHFYDEVLRLVPSIKKTVLINYLIQAGFVALGLVILIVFT